MKDWEAWKFAFVAWFATVHAKLPKLMDEAAQQKDVREVEDMRGATDIHTIS